MKRILSIALLAGCGEEPSPAGSGESTGDDPATTVVPGTTSSSSATTGEGMSSSSSGGDASSEDSSDTGEVPIDDCVRFDDLVVELEAERDDAARWEVTNEFVIDTLFSEHGFPLRCDGRIGFVAIDPVSAAVAVVGDFNDWDPRAHPLAPAVEGFPLFVAFVDAPASPSLYKLVYDGADFVADPLARRFGWDEFGEYSLTSTRADASHHERWPEFADVGGRLAARDVVVWVPAGAFDRSDLPVLYLHDGQNLFAPDAFFGGWQASVTADALVEAGTIAPVLLVGIDNTPARFDEYTHVPDDLGDGPLGGLADAYATFVVDGVKTLVDDRYPTDPGNAGIAGSSLGGLVSMYIAWLHPDVFGHAASMSGTFGWGAIGLLNDTIADLFATAPPEGVVVYLDSGGGGPCPGGDDNYCVTLELADLLRDAGWTDDVDLHYRFAAGAPHNESAWAARFPELLTAWFPQGIAK